MTDPVQRILLKLLAPRFLPSLPKGGPTSKTPEKGNIRRKLRLKMIINISREIGRSKWRSQNSPKRFEEQYMRRITSLLAYLLLQSVVAVAKVPPPIGLGVVMLRAKDVGT